MRVLSISTVLDVLLLSFFLIFTLSCEQKNALYDAKVRLDAITFMQQKVDSLRTLFRSNEADMRVRKDLSAKMDSLNSAITLAIYDFIEHYPNDNHIAEVIASHADNMGYEDLFVLLDSSATYYSKDILALAKARLDALSLRKPGTLMKDMNMFTVSKQPVCLSNYIEEGKPTLIEFWGSWCRQCRLEAENIATIASCYREKGLNMVGISLDTDTLAWLRAIDDMQKVWPQISDLKGTKGQSYEIWGVYTTPSCILFDSCGVVVACDLRGEALRAAVEKVIVK